MFLKRKKSGTVKERGCADGRKQKEYVEKEDAASPSVSIPALMMSTLQDAIEERYIVTLDIPKAFIQTDQPDDDEVIIHFMGKIVEWLAKIDPKIYRDKIIINKDGKGILYAKVKKAIYGCVRSAYLFYLKLKPDLTSWEFKEDPYDGCTVNKTFKNGRNKYQCTIQWHVDDLKISCKSNRVIKTVVQRLKEVYGKIAPLAISTGKVHE